MVVEHYDGSLKAAQALTMLEDATQQGDIPVYCDTSPYVISLKEHVAEQNSKVKLFEPVELILNYLLDKLPLQKQSEAVALHITCSAR